MTEFAVGDEVLGWSWRRSSQAESVVVPADQLITKPPQLSWEVAGSLYIVGATAYAAVRAVDVRSGRDRRRLGGGRRGRLDRRPAVGRQRASARDRLASNPSWLAPKAPCRSHTATGSRIGCGPRRRTASMRSSTLFGPEYVQLALDLGVSPDRIDTIVSFGKAAEVGAKTEGSAAGTSREVLTEIAELVSSGRLDFDSPRPTRSTRSRRFRRARARPHARQDRSVASGFVTLARTRWPGPPDRGHRRRR